MGRAGRLGAIVLSLGFATSGDVVMPWAGKGTAAAQGVPGAQPQPEVAWLQLAARRTRPEAEALARDFARRLAGVGVHETTTGWFAVAIGPEPRAVADALRMALIGASMVPEDAFVVGPETYGVGLSGAPAAGASGLEAQLGGGSAGRVPPPRPADPGISFQTPPPRPQARPQRPVVSAVRRLPEGVRHLSGVLIDTAGGVLAPASGLLSCGRIEAADGQVLRVVVGDGLTGLAYLRAASRADSQSAPFRQLLAGQADGAPGAAPSIAVRFAPAPLVPGQRLTALVLAYPGRNAPRLSVSVQLGLDEAGTPRLRLETHEADAGAPLIDGAGRLVGVLTAPDLGAEGGWTSPALIDADQIGEWLAGVAGLAPAGTGPIGASAVTLTCFPPA